MVGPDHIQKRIERRFEKESAQKREKIPEGYNPLSLHEIITKEGRLFLSALAARLQELQNQNQTQSEIIKSIITKIESYQKNPSTRTSI